jgi:hypothetical protein
MSTADATVQVSSTLSAAGTMREAWRQVTSVRRSTQQFRARLQRALSSVENDVRLDPQLGDVAAAMTTVVRILDWAIGDLDRLKLPEELFEVVQPGLGASATMANGVEPRSD